MVGWTILNFIDGWLYGVLFVIMSAAVARHVSVVMCSGSGGSSSSYGTHAHTHTNMQTQW